MTGWGRGRRRQEGKRRGWRRREAGIKVTTEGAYAVTQRRQETVPTMSRAGRVWAPWGIRDPRKGPRSWRMTAKSVSIPAREETTKQRAKKPGISSSSLRGALGSLQLCELCGLRSTLTKELRVEVMQKCLRKRLWLERVREYLPRSVIPYNRVTCVFLWRPIYIPVSIKPYVSNKIIEMSVWTFTLNSARESHQTVNVFYIWCCW